MAEFRRLPTQQELQQILFMQGLKPQTNQQILQQNLAPQTVTPIPENVFQKIAGGAKTAGEMVNRVGTPADIAKLFPGYTGQTQLNIPTGFNFAPKQDPAGGVIPQGLQTQPFNINQILQAIKPADVLGISSAERAYGDIGMGKVPNAMDVADTLALGAGGIAAGKAAVKGIQATKGLPVGMSIQDVGGLLKEAPRSPLGFYSALEDTALNLQRNKGTGQAFLNDLQKGANVKAEEIKWTGLDEFLKNKPNVTKQEVQDYLANNRVEVQEVRSTVPRLPGEEMPGDKGAFLPKFGQYTLPGGENYREILLTMPSVPQSFNKISNVINQKIDALADQGINLADLPDTDIRKIEINKLAQERDKIPFRQPYKSTHFPQENILAHLRVNDRVDADGKKMLLIEEVQSDWHQAGRERGYAGAESKAAETAFRQYAKELADKYDLNPEQNLAMYATMKRMQPDEVAKYEQLQSAWTASKGGVPDAPFKDSWYQLALKRAIQYAAENGYERIGLTTGSQQAARFDLSKQVDAIKYNKMPDGRIFWTAEKDGQRVTGGDNAPNELDAVVGKEVAQRIRDGAESGKPGKLTGIDLQVGGEGMKKYYDEIYPKFLDKYGKKWGARVGESKLQGTVSKDELAAKVYGMGETYKNLPSELKRKIDQMYMGSGETVRYLDVTPEMKASVSKGQPLFQVAPAIPAAGLLAPQEERK